MSFKLNLSPEYRAMNRNPNVRPMPQAPYKAKRDWVMIGLMVAIGLLVGCAMALVAMQGGY